MTPKHRAQETPSPILSRANEPAPRLSAATLQRVADIISANVLAERERERTQSQGTHPDNMTGA